MYQTSFEFIAVPQTAVRQKIQRASAFCGLLGIFLTVLVGCSGTEVIESPKTGYVSEIGEPKPPKIVWTSRTLGQRFEYLGLVKSKSWTYDGALSRLVKGAKDLRADAIIDVHYEPVGFLKTMQAFAVKYTN